MSIHRLRVVSNFGDFGEMQTRENLQWAPVRRRVASRGVYIMAPLLSCASSSLAILEDQDLTLGANIIKGLQPNARNN